MQQQLTLFILLALMSAACQPAVATATATPGATREPSVGAKPSAPPAETLQPPTSTAAPGPRAFTEDFATDLSQWSFVQVDNGSAAPDPGLSAGYLRFDLTAPNQWLYAIYMPQTYADVRLDAQATVGGTSGAAGVVCRYSEQNGWYEFNIYPDQTYVLLYGQWLAPGVARFTPLFRSASEKIQAGENDIGLLCQGNILTPFINGVQMRQNVENKFGLTTGKVGLSAASFETAPMAILVDTVKVTEP